MAAEEESDIAAQNVGRYVLFREIAHGGMATVHLARMRGLAGFARTVAIKRLHPPFARDPEFVTMFLDEARLAARIQHPNVVPVLDVVASSGELFLVMEYVHGESLYKLLRHARLTNQTVPLNILVGVIVHVLHGLHAAHDARSERGDPLDIVHRDVSPQNVLVGADGVARVLDFGVAKAAQRAHGDTGGGIIKGKLRYMPPEQVEARDVDRRADVYSAAAMLWEALTQRPLFTERDAVKLMPEILRCKHEPPSKHRPDVAPELDAVVLRGLSREPDDRYATAHDLAAELELIVPPASQREISEWVKCFADCALQTRATSIAMIEERTSWNGECVPPLASVLSVDSDSDGWPAAPPSNEDAAAVTPPESQPRAANSATARELVEPTAKRDDANASHRNARVGARRGLFAAAGVAALIVPLSALAMATNARPASSRLERETVAGSFAAAQSVTESIVATDPNDAPPPLLARVEEAATSAPPESSCAAVVAAQAQAQRAASTPPRGCVPPFTIDKSGVRVPKRWCW
jgi:serine/threonine-protein kinase